jgi:iron(III) transport system permease protein
MLRRVTLPLVTPAMITSIVFSIVILWESFSIPAILGTPGRIYVFATYLYRLLNTPPPDLGLSAAIAVFFAVTAGLAVWVGLRVARRHHGARFQVIAGKGHRAVQIEVGWMKYPLAAFNLTVLAFALVIPYVTLVMLSLSANVYRSFAFSNLTLRHYLDHFRSPVFHEIFWNTLEVALVMSAATGVIALLVAYLDLRGRGPLKDLLSFIATFPIAVPGVAFVVGVAWAWLRPPLVLYGTIWIIIICQISRFLPLGVQHLRDGLGQIRPELEEAARTCGAGTFAMLRRITVPVIRPVAVATFLLLWMASMRDLLTPLFLGTGTPETSTLSQRIYFLWGEGLTSQSAALAVILVSLMAVLYVAMRIVLGRRASKVRSPQAQAPTHTAAVGA